MRGSQAQRKIGWIISVVAVIGLPLAFGCAASPAIGPMGVEDGSVPRSDGSTGRDAGVSGGDASGSDAGAVGPPRTGALETDGDEVACGDFLDDAPGGGADCSDPNCSRARVCCVESTSADCCGAPATLPAPTVDFRAASCALSSAAATCVSGVTGFGTAVSAFVRDVDDAACGDTTGAMAPQGGARSDAGLLFDQAHDIGSTAVAIEAHVGVGSAGAGSIDAIALGLTSQTDLGVTARVRPIVAIVVSATDQTIRAVAGDVSFDAVPLAPVFGGGGCRELDLRIETSPDGTFNAYYRRHDDGGALSWTPLEMGERFVPEPLSHPVVYGRTTNPGLDGVHAWVRSVGVAAQLCDVLGPARSTETVFTGTVTAANVRSVTRLGGLAAYELEGSIYSAGVDGNGRIDPTAAPTNPPLIDPTIDAQPFYAAGAFDPELSQVGANVRLYFTGLSNDGERSIGYVDYAADLMTRVTGSTPRQLFAPGSVGVLGADGPAYLEALDRSGARRRLLVFRAMVVDAGASVAHSEIRALELAGPDAVLGESPENITGVADTSLTGFYSRSSPLDPGAALYRPMGGEASFDRDEVAQPELVLYHGVFRVFIAGRRGARWSIGMLRSPDFQHFDLASTTPILSGSGAGFDAVSVSDPDVFIEGDRLWLYYSGANGVETRPGLATQTIPTL